MKNQEYYQNLLKKILYRSIHRGCKETDFLIGKFVEENLNNFSNQEIELLSKFIEEDDMLIYDWILNKVEIDKKYLELVKNIQKFHKINL